MWSLVLLLCLATGAWAQTRTIDLASFDLVWTTIRDTHWQKPPAGLDWDAMRAEYRPRVEKAATQTEARAAMQEMIGRLKQTHFAILPGVVCASLAEDAGGPGSTGIDVRVLNGEAVVTAVDPGSPAERAGVRTGWVIRAVNGREWKPVIEAARSADWAPVSHGGQLHDRASYRFFWHVLERAYQTGRNLPESVQSYFGESSCAA